MNTTNNSSKIDYNNNNKSSNNPAQTASELWVSRVSSSMSISSGGSDDFFAESSSESNSKEDAVLEEDNVNRSKSLFSSSDRESSVSAKSRHSIFKNSSADAISKSKDAKLDKTNNENNTSKQGDNINRSQSHISSRPLSSISVDSNANASSKSEGDKNADTKLSKTSKLNKRTRRNNILIYPKQSEEEQGFQRAMKFHELKSTVLVRMITKQILEYKLEEFLKGSGRDEE